MFPLSAAPSVGIFLPVFSRSDEGCLEKLKFRVFEGGFQGLPATVQLEEETGWY